jgi:hypothetical protein
MNTGTQIDGMRIAKDIASQSAALELLNERQRPLNQWFYALCIAFGAGLGWLVSSSPQGAHAQMTVAVTSGVAFFLAICAFQECIRLRRRVEAMLVLVKRG